MYAATHPYTVDENGNRKYVYCHWGVVEENKKCRDTAYRPWTRQIPECGAPHGQDCNADLGIVWTAGQTGEVLPTYEESARLRPSAQLVGRRQDGQTADPLCRTYPELVCAPHMKVNRPA